MRCYTGVIDGIVVTFCEGDNAPCVVAGQLQSEKRPRNWLHKIFLSKGRPPKVRSGRLFQAHVISVKGKVDGRAHWILAKPRNRDDDRILLKFACIGVGLGPLYVSNADRDGDLTILGSGRGLLGDGTEYVEYLAVLREGVNVMFQSLDNSYMHMRNDSGSLDVEEVSEEDFLYFVDRGPFLRRITG